MLKYFINTINKTIYFIIRFVFLQRKHPLNQTFLILFQILKQWDVSFLPKWYSQCIARLLIKKDNTRNVPLEEKRENCSTTGKVPRLSSVKLWIIQLIYFVTPALWSIILKTYSQCEISHINRKYLISVNICSISLNRFFPLRKMLQWRIISYTSMSRLKKKLNVFLWKDRNTQVM